MTASAEQDLIDAMEAADDAEIRSRLLKTIAETRQSIGLPTTSSTLSTTQLAATYRSDIAAQLERHGHHLDGYSASAIGREGTNVAELATQAEGLTPLGVAIVNGQVETVARLLDAPDDPNRPQSRAAFFAWEDVDDPLEWLPIHLAAAHGYREESVTIVDLLINAGADILAYCPLGETALHLASTFGWLRIMNRLLDAGVWADERTVPTFNRIAQYASPTNELAADATPLHIAAREGRTPAVRLLIERGASTDVRDAHARTPLHDAAAPWWAENTETIELLLSAGADRTARDSKGATPRDHAVERGFGQSAALLD